MLSENNLLNTGASHTKEVENITLKHLFSSEEWKGFFQNLAKITGLHFSIYDENGILFFATNENPVCTLIKSASHGSVECPDSCNRLMFESLTLNEPITYGCYSKIINFSVPTNFLKEKAVIVGRGNFASYEDFLEFLRIAKDRGIHEIPITTSLDFVDENYIKNISQYIHKTINYLLNNLQEKYGLTKKLRRFTSLVDTNIFEKLCENTDSLYRYIADTIEFVLGSTSAAILVLDNQTSIYKPAYVTGKYKDTLMGIQLNSQNTLLLPQASSSYVEIETEKLITGGITGEIKSLYLFPIVIDNTAERLIVIFGGELPQEDLKIINALCGYVEIILKNHTLRLTIDKKIEEILTSIFDSSTSIASLLNWEQLLQTIIEKATQLLKAEQGSIMLLDDETSELFIKARKSIDNIIKENVRLKIGEGIAGKVLESGVPLLVEDLEKDPRINQKNKPNYKTKSFVIIPIKIEDRISGVLNISDKITGEVFNENDLKLLQFFITNAAIAIERSIFCKKIEELKELSTTDSLTGILNRRYLNNRLSEEIANFNRYKYPFSFLIIDIDGFKRYNDIFGHLTGDKVLKTLATIIVSSIRATDIPVRFGGDEFVILLPQTPKTDAVNIAKRLRENIKRTSTTSYHKELPPDNLTVSMGLTSYPEDASSLTELFEKADHALYLAKKEGKDRLAHL